MMSSLIIVGAGPVGLFLALQFSRMGHSVLLVDQKTQRSPGSNAIGIMPPSLELFEALGLQENLTSQGAKIRDVCVFGQSARLLGKVGFHQLPSPFPFILSVPQRVTEGVLEDALAKQPMVERLSARFVSLEQYPGGVSVNFQDAQGKYITHHGDFCAACDGASSAVRTFLTHEPGTSEVPRPKRYKATFLMGDYHDKTGWGDEARLFFTSRGAVESFPLGQGQRRWIVQTGSFMEEPEKYLEEQVFARTGVSLNERERTWISPFGMQRFLAPQWHFDRVFLAGDSAHTMSPIGGQGMNTGFADARHLAILLDSVSKNDDDPHNEDFLRHQGDLYTRLRRKAAQTAIKRAEMSMALGTVRGVLSPARNLFLRFLLKTFSQKTLPRHYAMLTIPRAKEFT